jgi:hypothetical protein
VVATQPTGRAIHLIVENLSAHKTKAVRAWLDANPDVKIHYTPTYNSWLNQVELWFAKIERDCIARGIFTSADDLSRKLLAYISAHNEDCRPFKWIYSDRIRADSVCIRSKIISNPAGFSSVDTHTLSAESVSDTGRRIRASKTSDAVH